MISITDCKNHIIELVAFSGSHQEHNGYRSRWVQERTAHVILLDGTERQWGCRIHEYGPGPDDYCTGRSLSAYQFERLRLLTMRLARRRNFACWSRFDPPSWYNGNYPYRELHIVRVRLPDGRPVRFALHYLTNHDVPDSQRRKLESLLVPGSHEERLYRLFMETRALGEAVARRGLPSSHRRLVTQLADRELRRHLAFNRYVTEYEEAAPCRVEA